jgi:NitT/TauT family transport system permease protein
MNAPAESAQTVRPRRLDLPCALFAGAALISLFLPVAAVEGVTSGWLDHPPMVAAAAIALAAAVWRLWSPQGGMIAGLLVAAGAVAGAYAPLGAIAEQSALGLKSGPAIGLGATGVWLYLVGLGFLAWRALQLLSEAAAGGASSAKRLIRLLVPGLFGAWLLYLWQVLVTGFGVPQILLPSPQMIGGVILGATGTLWADFYQTFVKAVLSGFVLGCGAGFIVAVLVDRVPFLQRGLLPLGNLVSALPIVGVAPIMVMWFGFGPWWW